MYKTTLQLFVISLVSLFSCQNNSVVQNSPQEEKKDKTYPYYGRALEMAFPDKELDIPAYEQGKKEVQEDIDLAIKRGAGFDLPWTIQGPGNIGARVTTLGIHPEDENIMLAGFAGGGLWRTLDGGQNWTSVFDTELFNSIGDIAWDEKDPNTIYIGTGDPNLPGRAFIGDGLYKSTDMGESWDKIGLEEQKIIPKVTIHPEDSNILYAASLGLPFTRNETRGLYRSMDGGEEWEKIFYISDSTGVTDFIINPERTNLMYASTWDRVRSEQESLISGEGSGIYVSTDSGENWNRAVGIPDTIMGKTGIAICKNFPNNVYAVTVDTNADFGGLYRSTDYGMTFTEVETAMLREFEPYAGFGWYFGKVAVDPVDPDHIYILSVDLWETNDNGGFWDFAAPIWWSYEVHADKHDLHMNDSGDIILATDGGVYSSNKIDPFTWIDIENIPTTQFYRVGYNPHEPNTYYGGAQDNGTTAGNQFNINDWPRIVGGDGFQPIFDPVDPDHWFAQTQRGGIRMTLDNGQNWERVVSGLDGEMNWDMQYIMSPHDRFTLYTGTDAVYVATDSYDPEWFPISQDLTEGGYPTELSTSISDINESPLVQGHIYVGTSNGLVHRTLDGGANWTMISEELPNRYVTSVKPSPDFPDRVYVTFTGYKFNEFIPRVFRSDDNGDTWTSIASDLPNIAINDLYIIPGLEDRVLMAATDGGIYASVDYGASWERLGINMPNIPCFDLEYNVINNELVVASFGRGIMTYPLEELLRDETDTKEVAIENPIILSPNPASHSIQFDISDLGSEDWQIDILSQAGQLQKRVKNTSKLDIGELPEGSYFYLISSKEGLYSGKFSKIKN